MTLRGFPCPPMSLNLISHYSSAPTVEYTLGNRHQTPT